MLSSCSPSCVCFATAVNCLVRRNESVFPPKKQNERGKPFLLEAALPQRRPQNNKNYPAIESNYCCCVVLVNN